MSAEPKNLKQALDDIRGDLSPLREDGNLYDELVDLRNEERRASMSKHTFKGLVEEARKSADYWEEWQEKFEELCDLVDDLFEAMNDIHDECFNEFAEDGDVIERIRIRSYRAIKKAKGDQS